jgi:molecular chaperone GrpE
MVHQKWLTALHKVGVSVLPDEPGDAFNPSIHEALTHEPSQEFDEGSIIQVVQRGYKLNDVILRPALVRVSSGKLQADQEQAVINDIEGA